MNENAADSDERERIHRETQQALDELFKGARGKMVTVKVPFDLLPGLHKVAKQMTKAKVN